MATVAAVHRDRETDEDFMRILKGIYTAMFLVLFVCLCGAGIAAEAKEKGKKNIQPPSPIVTTWSKIKGLFE